MDSIIARLMGNMPDETKNEIEALEAKLSPAGVKKLHEKMDEHYVRLLRRKGEERVAEIKKIVRSVLAVYNEGTKDMANPYLETVQRKVVAVDPKTMTVVARYDGIRAAYKATGLYHGTIYECVHKRHEILEGRPGRKGYNTGGGKIWFYAEDWERFKEALEEKPEV